MGVEDHRAAAGGIAPRFAVVTVSDTRTAETDLAGAALVDRLHRAGLEVPRRALVRDRVAEIRNAVRGALRDRRVDVVLVTGGTGVSPRDVSPEALRPLLERELPGFGELFRLLSFEEIGSAAMLTRASAGTTADGKAVFLLPGAPKALALALDRLILPEIGHLLAQARRRD
ncbi:MAG: MogA/MoaB family molybdenum cofactor biosynthesis protein [Thermoanaerobaculia bacterium]|nr:MAG: MogA/MoaB family molybdenum cofactor biosynthesis protein [Thermoanaerobaculia bacterium]